MTSNNNIYELPKTYTVSYFNETEWNKNLTPEEILKRDELAELEYQDQVLNGPQYGPGGSQSREDQQTTVGKKLLSAALAASYFTPLGVVTGPLTVAGLAVGATVEIAGHIDDDDDAKKVGGFIRDMTLGAAVDGISAGTGSSVIKAGCKVYSAYGDAKDMHEHGYVVPTGNPRENASIAKFAIKYVL